MAYRRRAEVPNLSLIFFNKKRGTCASDAVPASGFTRITGLCIGCRAEKEMSADGRKHESRFAFGCASLHKASTVALRAKNFR